MRETCACQSSVMGSLGSSAEEVTHGVPDVVRAADAVRADGVLVACHLDEQPADLAVRCGAGERGGAAVRRLERGGGGRRGARARGLGRAAERVRGGVRGWGGGGGEVGGGGGEEQGGVRGVGGGGRNDKGGRREMTRGRAY